MRRLLALLLVLALAPLASAQDAPALKLAVEPALMRAAPGSVHAFNVTVHNPTDHTLTVNLTVRGSDARIAATLKETVVKVPAGEGVLVGGRVEIARGLPNGTYKVGFEATSHADVATASRAQTAGAILELRVGPLPLAKPLIEEKAPTFAIPPPADSAQPVEPQADAARPLDWGAVGVAAGVATAGGGALALVWAHRKWGLLGFAPLYTRLAKSRVLESPIRERIAALVSTEPGITFGELQRKLDVGAGTLTHHARMLEQAGVLFSSPDGQSRRFFLATHGRVESIAPLPERALAELARGPATLSALAQRLGVSRQALHYHVKKLAREGRIEAREDGRELLLAVPERAAFSA